MTQQLAQKITIIKFIAIIITAKIDGTPVDTIKITTTNTLILTASIIKGIKTIY